MTEKKNTKKIQKKYPTVILTAGGTGGHVFPALALAKTLKQKNYNTQFITDKRGEKFIPQNLQTNIIHPATLTFKKPYKIPIQIYHICKSIVRARAIIKNHNAKMVVGFGGYPALPATIAAKLCRIPLIIHEQNTIMGRANKLLAPYADVVACTFPGTHNKTKNANHIVTGLPIREEIKPYIQAPYRLPQKNESFNILVFGGSQGAQIFTQIIPQALAEISAQKRKKFQLTLQAQNENIERVKQLCHDNHINADIQIFFPDIYRRIRDAHLVICRAGASTLAEIAYIGRPAIIVPLPTGKDQNSNAQYYHENKKAKIINEKNFHTSKLKKILEDIDHIIQNGDEKQKKYLWLNRINHQNKNHILAQEKLASIIEDRLGKPSCKTGFKNK